MHTATNSRWLKVDRKFWEIGMVKNGCGHSGDGTLKLSASAEWTDGTNEFLYADTDSQKLKSVQNVFGGHVQKWMWLVWSRDSKID